MGLVHIPLLVDPVQFLLGRVPELTGRVDSLPDTPTLFFGDAAGVIIRSKDEAKLLRPTCEAINELAELEDSRIDVVIRDGFFETLADDQNSLTLARKYLRGRAVMLLWQVVPSNP